MTNDLELCTSGMIPLARIIAQSYLQQARSKTENRVFQLGFLSFATVRSVFLNQRDIIAEPNAENRSISAEIAYFAPVQATLQKYD